MRTDMVKTAGESKLYLVDAFSLLVAMAARLVSLVGANPGGENE